MAKNTVINTIKISQKFLNKKIYHILTIKNVYDIIEQTPYQEWWRDEARWNPAAWFIQGANSRGFPEDEAMANLTFKTSSMEEVFVCLTIFFYC